MVCMSPRHFSSKYGPYFVGQTFTRHTELNSCTDPNCSTTMAKIKKFFQFPRPKADK